MIKATIPGYVGNDAELRVSKSGGSSFLTFSVAHTEKDITTWIHCVCFEEKTISFNKDKLLKGARVSLYGDLKFSMDKNNNLRVELVVRDVVSVWLKDGAARGAKPTSKSPVVGGDADESEEDAPFLN